jgi:hypothetical protein
MLNPANLYVKIAVWLALAAAAVAILGTPVWYVNKELDAAFKRGVKAGEDACEARYVEALRTELADLDKRLLQEAENALAAQTRATQNEIKFRKTQKALDEALSKMPDVVACVASESVTDILRDAAKGDFETSLDEALPSIFDERVPDDPTLPGGRSKIKSQGTG